MEAPFYIAAWNVHFNKWMLEWASSYTPRSNIAWECCIQHMAIPSISGVQSYRKQVSSKMHKIILAKVQKGYNIKGSIKRSNEHFQLKCISTHCVLITTKFHEILLSGFSGVVDELFWAVSLILVKFLSSKRGITPKKKNFLWICSSTH